jgi:hypothetical protein
MLAPAPTIIVRGIGYQCKHLPLGWASDLNPVRDDAISDFIPKLFEYRVLNDCTTRASRFYKIPSEKKKSTCSSF